MTTNKDQEPQSAADWKIEAVRQTGTFFKRQRAETVVSILVCLLCAAILAVVSYGAAHYITHTVPAKEAAILAHEAGLADKFAAAAATYAAEAEKTRQAHARDMESLQTVFAETVKRLEGITETQARLVSELLRERQPK